MPTQRKKVTHYDNITDETFNRILTKIVNEMPAEELLAIPEIYTHLSEAFGLEVLDRWERERANPFANKTQKG